MASLAFCRPAIISQCFPPKPAFTEKNLPDLAGKVYLITGANTGVGKELARILYGANGTVYMACRTASKAEAAIAEIKASESASKGRLEFLALDLADLRSVKPAVTAFTAKEKSLHVLFNNAGVMLPAPGSRTAQGYDLEIGTNCLGHFLLAQLLTPLLAATAAADKAVAPRVVWVASMATEVYSPAHGIDMETAAGPKGYLVEPHSDPMTRYGISKAGNYMHSVAYARQVKADGIISVALNPGNLDSDLYRTVRAQAGFLKMALQAFSRFALYPPVYGAYTELFAGLSPEVTMEKTGEWIGPWGRFFGMRRDIAQNVKPISEGGRGGAEAFSEWSMEQVKPFM